MARFGLQWARMLGVSSRPMRRMLVLTNRLDECQACTELFGGAKGETVEESLPDLLARYGYHAAGC